MGQGIIAILGFLALFLIVFELVRRRRLQERYALLWLFAVGAIALIGFVLWARATSAPWRRATR